MKTAEVRRRFIDFFAKHEHTVVPSASLLYNDPTLLFINAGMVPFKPYLMGEVPSPYKRAVSVQKCVRTLDIDEVGKTTRHGTFFQMCGNFSFGDYFKQGAIELAWDLVTSSQADGGYGFDGDKIWVTALHGDDESVELWKQVGVNPKQIQLRGLKDNYWHMGIPGPGGPCSEIYVDRGSEFGPDGGPEADEDRFLEIWNLVFETEELSVVRAKDDFDVAKPLQKLNVDTGAGLERIAYLLQGKANMYEIDEVYPVIEKASEMSGKKYGANRLDDIRFRVVADHVRSGLMLMTDGVSPSNEARGYVLRRLLRRSIRAMRLLGVQDRVLKELLTVSKEQMVQSYPDIETQWQRVLDNASREEDTFRRTLKSGTSLFESVASKTKNASSTQLSGDDAFQLHDTYGFPIDLTLEMASEVGLSVDRDRFNELMLAQKERARADAKSKKTGSNNVEVYTELRKAGDTPFTGYTELVTDSQVRGIIKDGKLSKVAHDGDIVEVVLEKTPFYAERGGQDSDRGVIVTPDGTTLNVLDVQHVADGLIVHKVQVNGELLQNASVTAEVDEINRFGARQAHTATHIIHACIREIVGPTATQAGSFNKPGYLRFDYSSTRPLSQMMKSEIEDRANLAVKDDLKVGVSYMPLSKAEQIGAVAMFGERYENPEHVRVVEIAGKWSRELCGGTHLDHTGQVRLITLMGDQSIGTGVRRLEALVADEALHYFATERTLVTHLTDMLKVRSDELPQRISKLLTELKQAEKQVVELRTQQLLGRVGELVNNAREINGVLFVASSIPGAQGQEIRNLASEIRARLNTKNAVITLIGGSKDKPQAVVATTELARESGLKAGALISLVCKELGGSGGGRDDMAQGGGTDSAGLQAAFRAVEQAISGCN